MKILIVLSHELYLRNFSNVLAGLADNGHHITLAFSASRNLNISIDELVSNSSNITVIDGPERSGWWWPVSDVFRSLRDFVHCTHPVYRDTPKIRERAARTIPSHLRNPLEQICRIRGMRRFLLNFLNSIEWSIPCDPSAADWIKQNDPDCFVVSPLIDMNYLQTELLKSARFLGLPSTCLVASWDNLTMKGQLQIKPDRLVVWNEYQKSEAKDLHLIGEETISVTGAQLYDRWFESKTELDRVSFCHAVGGLNPERATILYAGSAPFICPNEVAFFNQWYQRLRANSDPNLATANVLVRPHPLHADQWSSFTTPLNDPGQVSIWPADGEMPITKDQKQRYFDCLYHADVVVGVNTSTFLEASILGKQTFVIKTEDFDASQMGTLHFRYLVKHGIVKIADNLDQHFSDIQKLFTNAFTQEEDRSAFLKKFLRPHGITQPTLPHVIAAIERTPTASLASEKYFPLNRLVRILIWPLAALYLRPAFLKRRHSMTENR